MLLLTHPLPPHRAPEISEVLETPYRQDRSLNPTFDPYATPCGSLLHELTHSVSRMEACCDAFLALLSATSELSVGDYTSSIVDVFCLVMRIATRFEGYIAFAEEAVASVAVDGDGDGAVEETKGGEEGGAADGDGKGEGGGESRQSAATLVAGLRRMRTAVGEWLRGGTTKAVLDTWLTQSVAHGDTYRSVSFHAHLAVSHLYEKKVTSSSVLQFLGSATYVLTWMAHGQVRGQDLPHSISFLPSNPSFPPLLCTNTPPPPSPSSPLPTEWTHRSFSKRCSVFDHVSLRSLGRAKRRKWTPCLVVRREWRIAADAFSRDD